MSYILDALRKADAQREAGTPRGLHGQSPGPGRDLRRGGIRPVWAGAGVAIAAVAAAGAWWTIGRDPEPAAAPPPVTATRAPAVVSSQPGPQPAPAAPPPEVSAAVTPPPASVPPMAAPAQAPEAPSPGGGFVPVVPPGQTIARPRSLPGLAPGAAVPATAVEAPPQPAAPPPPVTATLPAPPPPRVPERVAPPPAAAVQAPPAAQPAPSSAVTSATPAEGGGRVHAFTELPADVQQALPKLQVSGGVHSPNPAQRMLIVGGQVFGEGSEVAPGVVLEQVRPRTAVLRFRGWRYAVAY